ncbi:MAG: hypothetical protein ABEH38_04850 [Flavobacteriales bacterium]
MRKIGILSTLFLFVFLAACKKYDEGPFVSVRSKKERIVNEWKVDEATADDGSETTSQYDGEVWKFTDDNEYFFRNDSTGGSQVEGKWHFEGDKEEIYLSGPVYMPHKGEYNILRLKEEELWLVRESDNEEIHLIPN